MAKKEKSKKMKGRKQEEKEEKRKRKKQRNKRKKIRSKIRKSVDFDIKSHKEGPQGGGGASQSKAKLVSARFLPLFEHARAPTCC